MFSVDIVTLDDECIGSEWTIKDFKTHGSGNGSGMTEWHSHYWYDNPRLRDHGPTGWGMGLGMLDRANHKHGTGDGRLEIVYNSLFKG